MSLQKLKTRLGFFLAKLYAPALKKICQTGPELFFT